MHISPSLNTPWSFILAVTQFLFIINLHKTLNSSKFDLAICRDQCLRLQRRFSYIALFLLSCIWCSAVQWFTDKDRQLFHVFSLSISKGPCKAHILVSSQMKARYHQLGGISGSTITLFWGLQTSKNEKMYICSIDRHRLGNEKIIWHEHNLLQTIYSINS